MNLKQEEYQVQLDSLLLQKENATNLETQLLHETAIHEHNMEFVLQSIFPPSFSCFPSPSFFSCTLFI